MRSRTPWDRKLILLPFLAASLSLFLWSRPFPESFQAEPIEGFEGVTREGKAYVCQRGKRPDISEACIYLIQERR